MYDDSDNTSNRQRRKNARRQAQRLRRDPAWQQSPSHNRAQQRLQDAITQELAEQLRCSTDDCPQCLTLREESNDPSQLCQKHLAQAMGLDF